jgi:hypothetical protein
MGQYILIPKSSHNVVEVATTTSLKTVLQVATPSTTDIRVCGWGISFDGIVVTNPSGKVELIDVDVAATSLTAMSPEKYGSDDNPASLCVSGTSASGYGDADSAEGTITASRLLDAQNVHPQGGYAVWFPERARPKVKASRFLRIRTTFSVDINCIPWIVFEEPA